MDCLFFPIAAEILKQIMRLIPRQGKTKSEESDEEAEGKPIRRPTTDPSTHPFDSTMEPPATQETRRTLRLLLPLLPVRRATFVEVAPGRSAALMSGASTHQDKEIRCSWTCQFALEPRWLKAHQENKLHSTKGSTKGRNSSRPKNAGQMLRQSSAKRGGRAISSILTETMRTKMRQMRPSPRLSTLSRRTNGKPSRRPTQSGNRNEFHRTARAPLPNGRRLPLRSLALRTALSTWMVRRGIQRTDGMVAD